LERLSVHRVRLRHQVEGEDWVWWLERDIPPYDRIHCESNRRVGQGASRGMRVHPGESPHAGVN
jgi:hypothetical protein